MLISPTSQHASVDLLSAFLAVLDINLRPTEDDLHDFASENDSE
jgi:hypothetical protein